MTSGLNDVCAMMKRMIESTREEIKRKRERIFRIDDIVAELMATPPVNTKAIALLREEKMTLERELEQDTGQLNAMEEEFSAECA